ncbi:hypothetical protein GPECTOR_55g307 [Gonium pectorale]|uniref:Protein kinase domain-containing protein n=1 Tax=Gonium pectorale TaxID=33097 RepID=A0A150G6E8_GONPE|nr:hypothetical protein GPECTOR_55g307 [Gonium pectorale]|eukprot:KXZ45401.1 hypothetical protein GPECTOR_55g307 [Gonium pectorale]
MASSPNTVMSRINARRCMAGAATALLARHSGKCSILPSRLCITRPPTPAKSASNEFGRCVALPLPLLLLLQPSQAAATGLPASNDSEDHIEGCTPPPVRESPRPPSYESSFGCAPAPAPAPIAPTTSRLEDVRSLVFGDPSSPPAAPTESTLTFLRRAQFVLEELLCFQWAQPTLHWLPALVPVGLTPEQLHSTATAVELLLASLPAAPPSTEALEAAMGRIFMARQEVALRAAGCSDAKDAVERLPALTDEVLAAASNTPRHPSQPQLLQARAQGHQPSLLRSVEAAAAEPINAGGLQDASVALHGEGGPFLAPLHVTVRPLQGPPHVHGYDLEVVFVFEYEPQGDGVQAVRSHTEAILEDAVAEIGAEAEADHEAGELEGADTVGSAAWIESTVSAVSVRAARSLVATMEALVGAMAAALAQLHDLGFMASDNKPANFLPGARGGRGLLTDSEAVDPCGPHEVLPGSGLHTTYYAAPEQKGHDGGSPRRCQASDVFTLGSSAVLLLEGAAAAAQRHGLSEVSDLLQDTDGLGARLYGVAAACLGSMTERPTAAEVAAILRAAA